MLKLRGLRCFILCFLCCSSVFLAFPASSVFAEDLYKPTWNERLFDAKIEGVKTRLNGMDKAIEVQSIDIDRRMLQADGTKEMARLEHRITALETHINTLGAVIMATIIIIGIILKVWPKDKISHNIHKE